MSTRVTHPQRKAFFDYVEPPALPKEVAQMEAMVSFQTHREAEARNRLAIQGTVVSRAELEVELHENTLAQTLEDKERCANFLREKVLNRAVSVNDIRKWEGDVTRVGNRMTDAREKIGIAKRSLGAEQMELERRTGALRTAIVKLEKYRVAVEIFSGTQSEDL